MTSSTMTTISSAGLRLATLEARDALRQRAGGDEDVTLTGVAGHETEALLGVEELHLASRHGPPLCRVCGFGTRAGTNDKANRSRVPRAAGLWMPGPATTPAPCTLDVPAAQVAGCRPFMARLSGVRDHRQPPGAQPGD